MPTSLWSPVHWSTCLALPFTGNQVIVTIAAVLKVSVSFPLTIFHHHNEYKSLLGSRNLRPLTSLWPLSLLTDLLTRNLLLRNALCSAGSNLTATVLTNWKPEGRCQSICSDQFFWVEWSKYKSTLSSSRPFINAPSVPTLLYKHRAWEYFFSPCKMHSCHHMGSGGQSETASLTVSYELAPNWLKCYPQAVVFKGLHSLWTHSVCNRWHFSGNYSLKSEELTSLISIKTMF